MDMAVCQLLLHYTMSYMQQRLLRLCLANEGLPGGYCGDDIFVFPYWCFGFFLSQEKPFNLGLFSVEARIWQAFQSLQPPRGVRFVCLNGDYGQQVTKWKTFPGIEYFIRFVWYLALRYLCELFRYLIFNAKLYFLCDK